MQIPLNRVEKQAVTLIPRTSSSMPSATAILFAAEASNIPETEFHHFGELTVESKLCQVPHSSRPAIRSMLCSNTILGAGSPVLSTRYTLAQPRLATTRRDSSLAHRRN